VETKPDLTPVSEADRAVEEALRTMLSRARPTHTVLGEEYGGDASPTGAPRWIIDPIDGTKNFVRGIPVWASLIALEEAGSITVGVVSAPALGRRWWAALGEGAHADGTPIHVSAVSRLEDAQFFHTGIDRLGDRELRAFLDVGQRCWRTRGFGDFWSHVLVAEGCGEIGMDAYGVNAWDNAAPSIVVTEAGGMFTDHDGIANVHNRTALSSNGLLHGEVISALAGGGA
jgi:histidinol-phosphatase